MLCFCFDYLRSVSCAFYNVILVHSADDVHNVSVIYRKHDNKVYVYLLYISN